MRRRSSGLDPVVTRKSRQVLGALRVRTDVRSGGITAQHNRRALKVRSGAKAGGVMVNHTQIARALVSVLKYADTIRRAVRG